MRERPREEPTRARPREDPTRARPRKDLACKDLVCMAPRVCGPRGCRTGKALSVRLGFFLWVLAGFDKV